MIQYEDVLKRFVIQLLKYSSREFVFLSGILILIWILFLFYKDEGDISKMLFSYFFSL